MTTNDKVQTETEVSVTQPVTGLKVSIYQSGTVTFNGEVKQRSGGVSLSKNGNFLIKFSGVEAAYLAKVLSDNLAFIQSKIVDPELAELKKI